MTDYFPHQDTVVIISAILVLLALALNVVYRAIPGAKFYALGTLLFQLSILMFIPSLSKHPYIPALIIANLGFILAVSLQLLGLTRFFCQKLQLRTVVVFSLTLAVSYLYFTAIELNTKAQLIVMNFGLSVYFLKLLLIFFSDISKNYLASKLFMVPALIFSVCILLSRGLNAVLPNGFLLAKIANQFLIEGAFFITALFIAGFFVLSAQYQNIRLKETNIKIADESSEKSKLLKFINHEFRNHLSTISMKIDLMKSNEDYVNDQKLIEDINLISSVTDQLESLTNDIIDNSDYDKLKN